MKFEGLDVQRVVTRYGRMYVPSRDSVIGRSLRLYGEWAEHEISCISGCIRSPGTIVDVGGNIGTHAVALGARHPDCKIFSFEPQPAPFAMMAASVVFNGLENISLLNLGCDRQAEIHFTKIDYDAVNWNTGALSFVERTKRHYGIPLSFAPLDSIGFGSRVIFIKIDVEGMEFNVLSGAKKILATDRPGIIFEVLDIEHAFRCRQFLLDMAYRCYWLGLHAFNPRNYNRVSENIWSHGELSILAVPSEDICPNFVPESYEILNDHSGKTIEELRNQFDIPC